jgi:ATF/CREB family transcription factor
VLSDKTTDAPSQAPLGPPPKPSQGSNGDYFSQVHPDSSNNHPYQSEPNPFEAQFGNPSDTPGKLLPPVAALTSPSAVLPNETPGWSLRAGPLSPAMLAGPATADYFDTNYSRSFPTPNESGLRTGLTPGGGGSMFPAPSPNSQGIFNAIHLGAQTPNTLDFLRTGVSAKAAAGNLGPTSQPTETQASQSLDLKLPVTQPATAEAFVHPDADAANGLFMLAQSNGGRNGQFSAPDRAAMPAPASHAPEVRPVQVPANRKNRTPSSPPADADTSESEESEPVAKPATRSRGRRTVETKPANNRRKAPDQPVKHPAAKKQKAGSSHDRAVQPPSDDEDMAKDGPKMTDEEKRKNFLERNRYACPSMADQV